MLDSLFVTPAAIAIAEALTSAGVDGRLAVVGNAKLARALAANREVLPVGLSTRAAKRMPDAVADLSGVEIGALAAVIGVDLTTDPQWAVTLAQWTRAVRDGGALVLVDRGRAEAASRCALCAGLTGIEQRHAGRAIITSGIVSHFI